jgi:hypothetical protein
LLDSTGPTSHFRSSLILGRHGVATGGTAVQTSVTREGVVERRRGSRAAAVRSTSTSCPPCSAGSARA